MIDAYATILRSLGLDSRRATVGAIIAQRDARLVSLYVREFIADLQTWNDTRVASFLSTRNA